MSPFNKKELKCNRPLNVTKTSLPSLDKYIPYLEQIFSTRRLTNSGVFSLELEQKLASFLSAENVSVTNNGTLALMIAIQQAGLSGKKVATTPFTYVATISALLWQACTPVFVDIDPQTLCISPAALEECLRNDPEIAGVLPVHVYGIPCDVFQISKLCAHYSIPCIYDAAHAFGVKFNGRSIFEYGDYAIGSFHATKLFHCVEGGCIVTHSAGDKHGIELLRAFGHIGDEHFCLGINAKLSEVHAAMGLCMLTLVEESITKHLAACTAYDARLLGVSGVGRPEHPGGTTANGAYYPVILPDEAALLRVMATLAERDIYARRYFYPACSKLPYAQKAWSPATCFVAEDIASRVLCLPISSEIGQDDINEICNVILSCI